MAPVVNAAGLAVFCLVETGESANARPHNSAQTAAFDNSVSILPEQEFLSIFQVASPSTNPSVPTGIAGWADWVYYSHGNNSFCLANRVRVCGDFDLGGFRPGVLPR